MATATQQAITAPTAPIVTNVNSSAPTNANVNTPVSAKVSADATQLDEFGRDTAERTVELSPRAAEMIDQEVTHGKWQTYDDALAHVIARGLAEIKRTREASRQLAEKSLVKAKRDGYANLMKANPSLIANAEFVNTMLRDLGVVPNGTKS